MPRIKSIVNNNYEYFIEINITSQIIINHMHLLIYYERRKYCFCNHDPNDISYHKTQLLNNHQNAYEIIKHDYNKPNTKIVIK